MASIRVNQPLSRRNLLSASAAALAASLLPHRLLGQSVSSLATRPVANHRFKIAASDWMLLKRQKISAIPLAHDCGLDGIELDMGPLGDRPEFKNELKNPGFRADYLADCRHFGIEICSLAMSAFYGQSWADHPRCDAFTSEWIDLMSIMKIPAGFLPVSATLDLRQNENARARVITHLQRAAPAAEKAGVILGVEVALDTNGFKSFLQKVASPAVRIDFNVEEQMKLGADVYQQLRDLGKDAISQIHCTTADGALLESGPLDMPRFKSILDDIGWSGWLVLQRSRLPGKSVRENFSANAAYLKRIFQQT